MSSWAKAPPRGLDPIKLEHKEHYGDPNWESFYLPQFEPDISYTKELRDKVYSSSYGKVVPVIVRAEKVEEAIDPFPRLPAETESLRRQVWTLIISLPFY
jgi:hypothetical protein